MTNDEEHNLSFAQRVQSIVKAVGGISKFSSISKISKRVISKYISGESEPTRPKLVAMADTGGVTVEWLVTGKASREYGPVDFNVLQKIIFEVEKIFNEYEIHVDPDKKGKFISNLYEEMKEDGRTIDEVRKEIVRIAMMMK